MTLLHPTVLWLLLLPLGLAAYQVRRAAHGTTKSGLPSVLLRLLVLGLLVLALADSLPNYQRDRSLPNDKWPVTLDAAIGQLETALPLKMRVAIANMGPDEIVGLNATIGNYIRTHYGLGAGNHDLMRSCADTAGRARLDQEDVSALILDRLALRLKETHRLRVIK